MIFWNLWEHHLKGYIFPCQFYACKAGLKTCYVTTDGCIYTCIEIPEFKIGDVKSGLNVQRIREIIYREDQGVKWCKNCKYINHCQSRGCQASNYEIHQNIYLPVKVNCEVSKCMFELIEANLTERQLNKMREENGKG